MSQSVEGCVVCSHPDWDQINREILDRVNYSEISYKHKPGGRLLPADISAHKKNCMIPLLEPMPMGAPKGGRPCTVCTSPHRDAVERARVLRNRTFPQMTAMWKVSADAIKRHFEAKHITDERIKTILLEAKRETTAAIDSEINEDQVEINSSMQRLVRELDVILQKAKTNGDDGMALASISELRKTLLDLAKLYGQLREVSTVEIKLTEAPQWVQLRAILGEIFAEFPDAGQRFIHRTRRLQLTMDDSRSPGLENV